MYILGWGEGGYAHMNAGLVDLPGVEVAGSCERSDVRSRKWTSVLWSRSVCSYLLCYFLGPQDRLLLFSISLALLSNYDLSETFPN